MLVISGKSSRKHSSRYAVIIERKWQSQVKQKLQSAVEIPRRCKHTSKKFLRLGWKMLNIEILSACLSNNRLPDFRPSFFQLELNCQIDGNQEFSFCTLRQTAFQDPIAMFAFDIILWWTSRFKILVFSNHKFLANGCKLAKELNKWARFSLAMLSLEQLAMLCSGYTNARAGTFAVPNTMVPHTFVHPESHDSRMSHDRPSALSYA